MAISQDINDKQNKAIIESADVAGQPGLVVLNADGTALGAPVGGATASNQTDGSQKTQIVDAGGEVATVTGGKLDVNATASLAGETLPVSGATEGVAVAIVDGSGNQITSFGGGTQYTEGDTDTTLTGTVAIAEGPSNIATPLQVDASKHLQVDIAASSATVTVDGSGVTQPISHAALTELAAAINTDKVDVHIKSSDVATGGTSAADDADFTATTTSGTPAMGVYESTPTSVTDGDLGVAGITATRALKVQAQANSGVDIGDVTINNATIAVTQSGTWDEVGINDSGNSITVDGTVTANLSATDNAVLDDIASDTEAIKTSLAGTLTVTGGGGGVEYTEGDTDATIVGSAIMWEDTSDTLRAVSAAKPLPISDAGGALTVDGTVAATQSGTWNVTNVSGTVSLPTGASTAANQSTIIGHVDGIETVLGTIDTDTGNIATSVALLDDAITTLGTDTYTEATSKGITIGAVRRDADTTLANTTNEFTPLQVDAAGRLKVEAFSGETLPVSLTSTTVTGTVAVTQSGTWDEVGIHDSGNSITVDYATTGSGTATGALRVELPTNGTGVIATVGAVTAITNALPAGTNAIGKLAANSGVDIGDVTLTAGTAAIGTVLPPDTDVTSHTNYARKYYTSAGAATDGIIWSPAAGKRWHVVTMYINVSAAATVTLEDDKAGGDDPVWKGEIAANSGVVLQFPEHYPMASGEDAADLIVTSSAGNIYITCVGYEI